MIRRLTLIALIATSATMLAAKDSKDEALPPPPQVYTDMVNCRTIADPTERLACYDREVAAFEQAQKNEDVIMTDKASVREAKKEAFGLDRPELKILGKEGRTEIEEVEGVVADAATDKSGKWMIVLESGARWQQIDTTSTRMIKPGMKLRIRRASLGSYFVNVEGRPAIRMKRVS